MGLSRNSILPWFVNARNISTKEWLIRVTTRRTVSGSVTLAPVQALYATRGGWVKPTLQADLSPSASPSRTWD
jgi:hypothetical protein